MRPQNRCRSCSYTWYPRGKNVSLKCPGCGSPAVELVPDHSCLILLVVLFASGIALCVFSGLSRKPPTPAQLSAQVQPQSPKHNAPTPSATASNADDTKCRQLLEEALALAARRDFEPALAKLRQARTLKPGRAARQEIERLSAQCVDACYFKGPPVTPQPSNGGIGTATPKARTIRFAKVTLDDGSHVEGEVVRDDWNEIVLKVERGTLAIDLKTVQSSRIETRKIEVATLPHGSRVPDWKTCESTLAGKPWGQDLREIPATVIETGVMRHVPYTSHRAGNFEVNVYGDPDAPAAFEIGIVDVAPKSDRAKEECFRLVLSMLQDVKDQAVLRALNRQKDRKERAELVFEVTPPEAEDAQGGWWLSVYDERKLENSRATPEELAALTANEHSTTEEPQPDPYSWAPHDYHEARSPPPTTSTGDSTARGGHSTTPSTGKTVYVRGYYRKDGTYVRPHTRRAPRSRGG